MTVEFYDNSNKYKKEKRAMKKKLMKYCALFLSMALLVQPLGVHATELPETPIETPACSCEKVVHETYTSYKFDGIEYMECPHISEEPLWYIGGFYDEMFSVIDENDKDKGESLMLTYGTEKEGDLKKYIFAKTPSDYVMMSNQPEMKAIVDSKNEIIKERALTDDEVRDFRQQEKAYLKSFSEELFAKYVKSANGSDNTNKEGGASAQVSSFNVPSGTKLMFGSYEVADASSLSMKSEPRNAEELSEEESTALTTNYSEYDTTASYDLQVMCGAKAVTIQDGGSVAVTMKLPAETSSVTHEYRVLHWDEDKSAYDEITPTVNDNTLTFTTTSFSPYVIATKEKVIDRGEPTGVIFHNVNGQEDFELYSNGYWYNEFNVSLNTNYAGIEMTEDNMKSVIPQFVDQVLAMKNVNPGIKMCHILVGYGDEVYTGIKKDDSISIPFDKASYGKLKEAGIDFRYSRGLEDGTTFWYNNIQGPTDLGVCNYDYLENVNWDFFGSGFEFSVDQDGIEFAGEGTPQLLVPTDDSGNNMKLIEAGEEDSDYSVYGKTIFFRNLYIEHPGLHFVVPKADTTNVIMISSDEKGIAQADLKKVIAPSLTTVTGTLDVSLSGADTYEIDPSVFEQLKENKSNVSALTFTQNGVTYELPSENVKNEGVTMNVGAEEATTKLEDCVNEAGEKPAYAISFADNEKLPGTTYVTFQTGLTPGDEYTWNYVDEANRTMKQESVDKVVIQEGGWVTVPIDHCSSYALTKGAPSTGGGSQGGGTTGGGSTGNSGNSSNSGNSGSGSSHHSSSGSSSVAVTAAKTGDTAMPFAWGMVAVLSLLAVAGAGYVAVKRRKEYR